jgi:hypothetical protein
MRTRVVVGVVAGVVLVLGAGAFGVVRLFAPPDAAGVLQEIDVHGYSRTAEFGISDWAHGAAQENGVYMGPPATDGLAAVITAPGLVLHELTPQPGAPSTDATDAVADGDLPDRCELSVGRLRKGEAPQPEWQISEAQLADVRAGRLDLLVVEVDCFNS